MFKLLIISILLSACGRFPTKENVDAFNSGSRGYIKFDISEIEGTVYGDILRIQEPIINRIIQSECMESMITFREIDFYQGNPISFVLSNINSNKRSYGYLSSQKVTIPMVVDDEIENFSEGTANGNIILSKRLFELNMETADYAYNLIHEITHYLGFSHDNQGTVKYSTSFPVVAGRSGFICSRSIFRS